jgi:hypothetical protein
MEAIRDFIEWISTDTINAVATIFPYVVIGLIGLYGLWLLIGYLRVSQVGIGDHVAGPVVALPPPAEHDQPVAPPPGIPYCATDGLQYPVGARFCTRCERDLVLACAGCGATVSAADASCYRCGTPTGAAETALPG